MFPYINTVIGTITIPAYNCSHKKESRRADSNR
jgi:hypothetical protein